MKQFSVNFKIPLGSIFSSLVKDKDFIADCKALLTVDNDKIESLAAELDKQNLFADQKIIGSLAEKYLGDESPKIVHLMSRLCELIDEDGNGVAAGLDLVSEQLTARIDTSVMTEEEKTELVRRLNLLLRANGVLLQDKAQSLAMLGVEVESINLVCDLRPVFNVDQTEIVGAIPMVTLFLDVAGKATPHIFCLSESMLRGAIEKFLSADKKLLLLKSLCDKKEITIPDTLATVKK